ncbi:MAG: Maf-like protein [Isosphaeraceae bacterium]|jgi:septum formation protein|nr:MAG: Maf-like protein [Isosphaeraceae bacterium]
MNERPLVLASTSPYRRQLLERLRVPFECEAPEVDETAYGAAAPAELASTLARAKAAAVAERFPRAVVIGGDQVVALGEAVLGKAGSAEAAVEQLGRLAGRTHELITAVVVVAEGVEWSHVDRTRMRMRTLSEAEIRRYVDRERPWDCAGSYKIESLGISLFEAIEGGDPTAIVGLPLMAVARALRQFGFDVP